MSSSSAMARILIKGGKVVNDDCTQEADVYIENGVVQQVGRELMIPGGAKVIDASRKLVMPGGIDTSVHLQETFMNAATADDYYSGTKVPGGVSVDVSMSLGLDLSLALSRSPFIKMQRLEKRFIGMVKPYV